MNVTSVKSQGYGLNTEGSAAREEQRGSTKLSN